MKTLALVLLLCCPAIAETAYKSLDGNLYLIRDSAAGPRFEKLTIVDLTDGGPTNPVPPTDDKFGLVKASREAASKVVDYDKRDEHQTKLSAYYTGLANAVEGGSIPQDKLSTAVDVVYLQAVGQDADKWQSWKDSTTKTFSDAPINTKEDAAQGLRDIAIGLVPESNRAVDWEALIKFFIEVILPLIIKLIGS